MNLEEVARRAGVSIATASRVLNNAPRVRAATRSRVMSIVEKLNYHPNLHARSLAGGKSRSIGLIVSNIENPFFQDIYIAVEAAARADGYEIILSNTGYCAERLETSIRSMVGRRITGLAMIVSEMHPDLVGELNGSGIPVVCYDGGITGQNITAIRVNYHGGIDQLASYLYGLGHRRMGIVGHHALMARMNGPLQAAMERAHRYRDVDVKTAAATDSFQGGRCAARNLLDSHPGLTAMLCLNDSMAIGAMRGIRDRGLRVPQDISVTGFEDVELAQFCDPALTSVRVSRAEIAKEVWRAIVPKEKAALHQEIVIEPQLVLRSSTAPAKPS